MKTSYSDNFILNDEPWQEIQVYHQFNMTISLLIKDRLI